MNKKPIIEVDEDMLRSAMLEVPAMRNRPSAETTAPERGTVREEPPHTEADQVKRGPYRKQPKEDGQTYRDRFLVNDGVRSRVTTAIDRDIHEKIRKLLSMVAPDITIVSYIGNVLIHHLGQYQDEIEELYKRETEKPF